MENGKTFRQKVVYYVKQYNKLCYVKEKFRNFRTRLDALHVNCPFSFLHLLMYCNGSYLKDINISPDILTPSAPMTFMHLVMTAIFDPFDPNSEK